MCAASSLTCFSNFCKSISLKPFSFKASGISLGSLPSCTSLLFSSTIFCAFLASFSLCEFSIYLILSSKNSLAASPLTSVTFCISGNSSGKLCSLSDSSFNLMSTPSFLNIYRLLKL